MTQGDIVYYLILISFISRSLWYKKLLNNICLILLFLIFFLNNLMWYFIHLVMYNLNLWCEWKKMECFMINWNKCNWFLILQITKLVINKKKKSYLRSKCTEKICLFSHLVHHFKFCQMSNLIRFWHTDQKHFVEQVMILFKRFFRYWSMLTIICFYS